MNHARIATAFLVVAGCLAPAQPQGKPSSVLEIAAIRDKRLDVRLHNEWPYPVAVQISPTPESNIGTSRLNTSGYFIEALEAGKWVQLSRRKAPVGAVWGDLPVKYLEIPPRAIVSLPAVIDPTIFSINNSMKLRLVVRVWRSETNVIGITRPIENEHSLLLGKPAFNFDGTLDDFDQSLTATERNSSNFLQNAPQAFDCIRLLLLHSPNTTS